MCAAEQRDPAERLPWTRREDGKGFRSLPDGPEHADRHAEIWYVSHPYAEGMNWGWAVHWGRARRGGSARSPQEASDRCNLVWPDVRTQGQRLADANREYDLLMVRIEDVARSGSVEVEGFGITEMDGKLLLQLVRHCREHWEKALRDGRPLPGIHQLMRVASAELHARRLEGRPAQWADGNFGQFMPRGHGGE